MCNALFGLFHALVMHCLGLHETSVNHDFRSLPLCIFCIALAPAEFLSSSSLFHLFQTPFAFSARSSQTNMAVRFLPYSVSFSQHAAPSLLLPYTCCPYFCWYQYAYSVGVMLCCLLLLICSQPLASPCSTSRSLATILNSFLCSNRYLSFSRCTPSPSLHVSVVLCCRCSLALLAFM